MMKKRKISIAAVVCILLAGSVGCKVSQQASLKEIRTPDGYRGTQITDTSSIGDYPWKQLFTDPYLVTLIDTALAQNRNLLQAVQRIEVARNRFFIAASTLRPKVEAQVSAAADRYGDYTMNGVGNFDTDLSPNINKKQRIPLPLTPDFFTGFRSTWELDIWGRLKNLRKASYARFLATQKGVQLVQTSLVAEVASRYYQLLALDNELSIIRDNIRLQDSALQIVKILKLAGRANELAVQQFSAQLFNTRALEGATLQQITEVENELSVLQGRYPESIARDTSFLNRPLPGLVKAGVPSQLLSRRPDIQQAEYGLIASRADVAAARASFYPSLTLTPYMGFNAFKLPLLFSGGSFVYGILGNLTATVFNQGMLKRGLKVAEATKLDAYFTYEQTVLNSVREVVNALNGIQNAENVYNLKIQEVQALNDAVSTSNLLFKTGQASYLEVITAQRTVVEAQLQLANTKKQVYLSVVELYRSLGGGWR